MKREFILLLSWIAALFFSCAPCIEKTESYTPSKPELRTLSVETMVYVDGVLSAKLPAEYNEKQEPITEKGIALSYDNFATDVEYYMVEGTTSGKYNYAIQHLEEKIGKPVYFKAYLIRPGGEVVYAECKSFYPADFPVVEADKPEGEVVVKGYNSAAAEVITPNLGIEQLQGFDANKVKLAAIGIRFWEEGQTEEDARELVLNDSEVVNFMQPGDKEMFNLNNLTFSTTYHYYFFVRIGVYQLMPTLPQCLMDEVHSVAATFATDDVPAPDLTTEPVKDPAVDITKSKALIQGNLNNLYSDIITEVGFKWGESAENLVNTVWIEAGDLNPDGTFSYEITGLIQNTEYYYQAIGRNELGATGEGGILKFTTVAVTLPDAGHVSHTIGTGEFTLSAQVLSVGGGDEVEWGFYYGTDPDPVANGTRAVVATKDVDGKYSAKYDGDFGATYYYVAFVKNETGEITAPLTPNTFMIENLELPVVDVDDMDEMNYAYRVSNVTATTALFKAKITVGNHTSMACGFYWGATPALGNTATATDYNMIDGTFSVTLPDLTAGTTYFIKPFAQNQAGAAAVAPTLSFRTTVDGGKQWVTDRESAISNFNAYKNIKQGTTDLIYIELDPVSSGTTMYYMLDRNMGAEITYTETGTTAYNITLANGSELFRAMGYLYQWGMSIPSQCTDFALVSNENGSAPMYWNNAGGNNTYGTIPNPGGDSSPLIYESGWPAGPLGTWLPDAGNPCPPDYRIPSATEWLAIVGALPAAASDNDRLYDLWKYLRLGRNMTRGNNGGGVTNPTLTFACSTNQAGNYGGAIFNTGSGVLAAPPGNVGGRYSGAAVRCIRSETIP